MGKETIIVTTLYLPRDTPPEVWESLGWTPLPDLGPVQDWEPLETDWTPLEDLWRDPLPVWGWK